MKLTALCLLGLCSLSFAGDVSQWDLGNDASIRFDKDKIPIVTVKGETVSSCYAAVYFMDIARTLSEHRQTLIEDNAKVENPERRVDAVIADRVETVEILSALCMQRKLNHDRLTPRLRDKLEGKRGDVAL